MEQPIQDGKKDEYLERLSFIIKKVGGNNDSARIMGKSVKSVERYKKGAEMPFEAALQLVRVAGVTVEWLATGEGSPDGGETIEEDYLSSEYVSKYMVNLEDVKDAVEALFDHLKKNKRKLTPEKAAQIIVLMLQMDADEQRENADDTNLIRLIDLAD